MVYLLTSGPPSNSTYSLRLRSCLSCWNIGRRDFSTVSTQSLATPRTPLQLTLIFCKSSWNDCRQVLLGRPLLLLPPSGTHCIATLAGLSGGSRSICPCNHLTITIFKTLKSLTVFKSKPKPRLYGKTDLDQNRGF